MKILILSLVFPPDNVSTAHIVGRLAAEFVGRGHEVVVLTSTPHYHPEGIDPQAGLTPVAVAQGSMKLENPQGIITNYGYENDVSSPTDATVPHHSCPSRIGYPARGGLSCR